MATPKKLHFKRNMGIAVAVIVIILIGIVAGFISGFFTTGKGGSNHTPRSGEPLQTPTSTLTPPFPTSAPVPTPTSTPATSTTPSPLPIPIAYNGTSPSGYYLSDTRIFLVSANASYGYYPYPTVTSPSGNDVILAENGEPCFIINVTIRSDYSTTNPPPNPNPNNPSFVYVFLTAQIFNGENQINATDITPPVGFVNGGAYAPLSSAESATVTIYLATNNPDITSFQIVSRFVSGVPPP